MSSARYSFPVLNVDVRLTTQMYNVSIQLCVRS